ncbi:MAG: radical SAM/SPASM domain-containing protein [Candidatus Acidiferrales bacterium]
MNTPVMGRWIRRSVERHLPWSVHLDLTYRCNERCVHCYLDHEDHGEMSTEEIKNVLDQLAEAGTLFLTFSGGEIFLRTDLFDLISYARYLHFDVSLKTNALLIDSERARRLRDLRVRRIQISIYSTDPEVHDSITKVRGSYTRTIAAIRFLQAEGLNVKIACPLMKQNLMAYRDVHSLAEELGVPYVLDLTITPKMDGDTSILPLRISTENLLPVLQDPILKAATGRQDAAPASASRTGSSNSSGIESRAYDDIPCSAGHNSCYISPYADVFPCVQMPIAAGNLRRERFKDVWFDSSTMNRVRAVRESQLPVCSGCSIREYCERCPGLAQMEGGDMLGAYERACEMAELNARVAGLENPVSAFHAMKAGSGPSLVVSLPPAPQPAQLCGH